MERSSEIYDSDDSVFSESESEDESTGSRASESTESRAMGPPRTIPPEEMILRIKNRQCKEDIESLRYDMSKKNAEIDVLKMIRERLEKEASALNRNNERLEKEVSALNIKYEVVKQRVAELTRELPNQGGTRKNKRTKYVSKYSTSSKNHASRRYSSKR